jgi:hypothetical protein
VVAAPRAAPVNFVRQFLWFVHSRLEVGGTGASAALRFTTAGAVQANSNTPPTTWADTGSWFSGTVDATYYVRFKTRSSDGGSLTGSDGVWRALSSNRSVEFLRSTAGVGLAVVDVQIASDSAGSNVIGAGTLELTAEFEP